MKPAWNERYARLVTREAFDARVAELAAAGRFDDEHAVPQWDAAIARRAGGDVVTKEAFAATVARHAAEGAYLAARAPATSLTSADVAGDAPRSPRTSARKREPLRLVSCAMTLPLHPTKPAA